MKAKRHYVYLLRCADGTYYCGYTTDVQRRLLEHNGEEKRPGAKYTHMRRPVQLIHCESFSTRSDAMKREAAIKKLSRRAKEDLLVTQ
jgi:putative endonuclease